MGQTEGYFWVRFSGTLILAEFDDGEWWFPGVNYGIADGDEYIEVVKGPLAPPVQQTAKHA